MAQTAENPSAQRPADELEDFPEIRPAAPEAPQRAQARRVERPPAESRRTRVQIRHVGVWSVFKFSVLFYFCLMLVAYLALLIIFLVMRASGALDPIEKFLGEIFNDNPALGTKSPPPLKIDGNALFSWLFLAGCLGTIVWSAVNVFVALIYNLISDVVGGIEVTLTGRRPR